MRVRYSSSALRELAELLDYITERSPRGAGKILARIRQIEKHIGQFPDSGAQTRDPSLRRMAMPPYPYLIFYEATGRDIMVHSIRHGSREPSEH